MIFFNSFRFVVYCLSFLYSFVLASLKINVFRFLIFLKGMYVFLILESLLLIWFHFSSIVLLFVNLVLEIIVCIFCQICSNKDCSFGLNMGFSFFGII